MTMLDMLLLPFSFPFMQQAFVISLLIAAPMALLSCFLILKGWSLMGDAVSHAVLPGVVIAYMAGLPFAIGAFVAGMVCVTGIGFLKENSRVKEDTVMGVVFSGMFGLGLLLYTRIQTDVHLDHILFGDMLGVTWNDIAQTGGIALAICTGILLFRRDLLLAAFDAQHARAIGLPVRVLHYGLLSLLSLAIVAALSSVGIILSIAMLIGPGAVAFLIVRRFEHMLLVSLAVALFSSFSGVYLSFFIDSAPAPTIVLLMTGVFIIAFVATLLRDAGKPSAPPA